MIIQGDKRKEKREKKKEESSGRACSALPFLFSLSPFLPSRYLMRDSRVKTPAWLYD
jgi:hypothetical protein